MNRRDLQKALRREFGFSWRDSGAALETILSSIKRTLRKGERVTLHHFGSFSLVRFAPRRFRNVRTGRITVKAGGQRVKFKPSKSFLKP